MHSEQLQRRQCVVLEERQCFAAARCLDLLKGGHQCRVRHRFTVNRNALTVMHQVRGGKQANMLPVGAQQGREQRCGRAFAVGAADDNAAATGRHQRQAFGAGCP